MDENHAVRFGAARAAGIGRSELDRRWAAPHWGIRTPVDDASLAGRCTALIPRLPAEHAFSHATAARLMGLPLPRRLESGDIHVAIPAGRRAVDAKGVVGHELMLGHGDRSMAEGLPITSPSRTYRDLAGVLGRSELVALGDAMVRRRAPLISIDRLVAPTIVHGRYRGRRVAVEALAYLTDRSESWPESLLRVALIDAGLPELAINEEIRIDGRFIARPDLRFRRYPLVVEYDGGQHGSDLVQWRRDVVRFEDIKEAGFDYVRATASDLPSFDTTIRRTRSALRRLGWR